MLNPNLAWRAVGVAALLPLAAFAADAMTDNPFAQPSALTFGYPDFSRIKDTDFRPAYTAGMAEHLREVEAIANNPEAPTFDNTLAALERSGQLLGRVSRTFSNLVGAHTNDARRALDREISPQLAAHSDAIRLNPKLFARIRALHERRETLGLDAESKRLLERTYKDFVRSGAQLSDADKAKLTAINKEVATLQTSFTQNVQNESNADAVIVDTREELAGLSETEIATAAAAAKAAGKPGKFQLSLLNTSGQPALSSLQNRALRERLHAVSLARCSHGGANDNRAIIARLARLRAERAQLLGYPNHAAYVLEEQTARSVGAVNDLLGRLAAPAVANAQQEAKAMQAVIDREKGGFAVTASDWDFYAEKVRREQYAFDAAALKPYLELDRVLRDGVFFAATKLYGITFRERKDLPVYEETVRVFDVFNADGSQLAIFLSDNYARPSKRGGAWASAYVAQSRLLGTKPVIANHLNIPRPAPGQPTLLTWAEVTTLFHEFGHALHAMFSDVTYPRFSGTSVPRDFVEFPSQVNEMWSTWPEILANYARHYQTGEPMPAALLAKVHAADKFNQGFKTTEYLAASLLDQAWHQLTPDQVPAAEGVTAFESAALAKAGVAFAPVPPRYRSAYFSHTFSGGYSAGYYSYIWSEVLDADTVEWFKQHGGLDRKNGDHFRAKLLSRGGSAEAMELYRGFRGGEPELAPLLKRRGLEVAPAAPKL